METAPYQRYLQMQLGDYLGLVNGGFGPAFATAMCNTGFGNCGVDRDENFIFYAFLDSRGQVFPFQTGPGGTWVFAVAERVGVPEPGTLALLGIGLAGIGMSRRKKKA